ncbi:hypothetical protein [Streptomyces cyaneofuscatus]|uniref:hypothetical protein n=1 Tax=Streptomyces cyaneofuscatus TaxID=66883 RepID=UPI0036467BE5
MTHRPFFADGGPFETYGRDDTGLVHRLGATRYGFQGTPFGLCGASGLTEVADPGEVTCPTCLAALNPPRS